MFMDTPPIIPKFLVYDDSSLTCPTCELFFILSSSLSSPSTLFVQNNTHQWAQPSHHPKRLVVPTTSSRNISLSWRRGFTFLKALWRYCVRKARHTLNTYGNRTNPWSRTPQIYVSFSPLLPAWRIFLNNLSDSQPAFHLLFVQIQM